MQDNKWITELAKRNEAISEFKAKDKNEYIKLRLGLTHGKGKRKKKK